MIDIEQLDDLCARLHAIAKIKIPKINKATIIFAEVRHEEEIRTPDEGTGEETPDADVEGTS